MRQVGTDEFGVSQVGLLKVSGIEVSTHEICTNQKCIHAEPKRDDDTPVSGTRSRVVELEHPDLRRPVQPGEDRLSERAQRAGKRAQKLAAGVLGKNP